MDQIKLIVSFAAGAAIGAVVTWRLLHEKHEQRIKEEIDSIRKSLSKMPKAEAVENDPKNEAADRASYRDLTKRYRTGNETIQDFPDEPVENDPDPNSVPYIITPDEFASLDGYDVISLTYFADHVLCDDQLAVIEDIEGTIGPEALDNFGIYDVNAVHVRNDRLKVDYEVLLDLRKYRDILEDQPYLNR